MVGLNSLTGARRLDVDRLKAAVEGRGVYDVRLEVAVGLAVDKEGHDDRDDQAHDDGDYDAHIKGHVVRAGSSCRGGSESGRVRWWGGGGGG